MSLAFGDMGDYSFAFAAFVDRRSPTYPFSLIFNNITLVHNLTNSNSCSPAFRRNTPREEKPMMEIVRLTEALALAILLLHER